jgi:aminobenzoyl-glutamate transport protein
MSSDPTPAPERSPRRKFLSRLLDWVERVGNRLPDPAMLFVWGLVITAVVSALLAPVEFSEEDPRLIPTVRQYQQHIPHTAAAAVGAAAAPGPGSANATVLVPQLAPPDSRIRIKNQLSPTALRTFMENMVSAFVEFPPLGIVLVAMLGVGVAEHTGFVNAVLKALLRITPKHLITPMLLVVAVVSHTAGDTGFLLVIPLGGLIFAAAGRHPIAGIVCAFAGVAGGFSANFIPSPLDALLQGFTQSAAQLRDPAYQVDILCNYYFMATSAVLIIVVGWVLTDWVIEPRLTGVAVDGDPAQIPVMGVLTAAEARGLAAALLALAACFGALMAWASLDAEFGKATLHRAFVPIIFILFLVPGVVHGYVSGTVKSHRDIIKGMTRSMEAMSYYLVMAFFAALFIYVFNRSNLCILLAVKGANFLEWLGLPQPVTIVGLILISALVNMVIGSASAKWALLSPIFVPMLMQLGIAPELTQAAYRIADSSTHLVTPLLVYFPLIVIYCRRYVTTTGTGTLISLMLPYSVCFLLLWTAWLMVFWHLGLPLGVPADTGYSYTPAGF